MTLSQRERWLAAATVVACVLGWVVAVLAATGVVA